MFNRMPSRRQVTRTRNRYLTVARDHTCVGGSWASMLAVK